MAATSTTLITTPMRAPVMVLGESLAPDGLVKADCLKAGAGDMSSGHLRPSWLNKVLGGSLEANCKSGPSALIMD